MSQFYRVVLFLCVVLFYIRAAAPLQDAESDTVESNPSEDHNYWNITGSTTNSANIEVTTYQSFGEDTELLAYLNNDTHGKEVERYKSNIFSIPKKQQHHRHHQQSENSVDSDKTNGTKITEKWITNVLGELLWEFAPTSENNANCNAQSELYKQRLKNVTLWAVQMLDASTRMPNSLLPGDSYSLGNFDECVSVKVPSEHITGRYCLADIEFAPSLELYPPFYVPDASPQYIEPDNRLSAWEKLKTPMDLSKNRRDIIHWAMCVPAACTYSDVETTMKHILKTANDDHGLIVNVTLKQSRCYSKRDEKPLTVGFYVVCGIFGLAITIAMFATYMDFFFYQPGNKHNRNIRRWVKPFSMYSNMAKLIKPNENREFAEFHLFKLFAIICVISGHRQMYQLAQTPLFNVNFVERITSYFIDIFILNGGVVVDTFFVLSGFLTCHFMHQELEKRRRFNFFVVLLNRWIRVAPVYMLLVAFYAFVFSHLGDGPLWTERIGKEEARCQQNWWTNLFFINNYVHSNWQCMIQSWYLACDMHFFIFGTILVYIVWRWRRLGVYLLTLSLLLSILIPGAITYYYKYYGVVLHYRSLMKEPMDTQQYLDVYIPSHARAGPYIVGLIAAYVYIDLKKRKYKFSQTTMYTASIFFGVLAAASIMVGWQSYERGRPYYRLENTLYAGVHRCLWGVGVIWFIIAEGTTGFGVIYQVIKHRLFTPFGRLTYCVFLVHTIPQLYYMASARVPEYLTIIKLTWIVTGDTALAFILGLFLNLLFEAPLERLQKKVIKKLLTGSQHTSNVQQQCQANTPAVIYNGKENNGFELQEKDELC